jgi:hypothetical protein
MSIGSDVDLLANHDLPALAESDRLPRYLRCSALAVLGSRLCRSGHWRLIRTLKLAAILACTAKTRPPLSSQSLRQPFQDAKFAKSQGKEKNYGESLRDAQ